MCKLNNILLNNQWVKKKKIRKYPAQMKTKQNIPIAKAVLRRKFVIHAYIKKRKSQTTQLYTFRARKILRLLSLQDRLNSKLAEGRKLHRLEQKQMKQKTDKRKKINETKSWFKKKLTNSRLDQLRKIQRRINNVQNERRGITIMPQK